MPPGLGKAQLREKRESRFDPHDHLVRQGWQGKGTALKHGHATRPLPVVQKKTMSGIGKDRDEAIPFWDHIFASTAASLASAATSGASTPTEAKPEPKHQALSIAARSSREIARRKLYSGFFRSTTASKEHTPKGTDEESGSDADDGGEGSQGASEQAVESAVGSDVGESSKAARRAARAARKAEKETRRAEKAASRAEKDARRAAREARKSGLSIQSDTTSLTSIPAKACGEASAPEAGCGSLFASVGAPGVGGASRADATGVAAQGVEMDKAARRAQRDARRAARAAKLASRAAGAAEGRDKEVRRGAREERRRERAARAARKAAIKAGA